MAQKDPADSPFQGQSLLCGGKIIKFAEYILAEMFFWFIDVENNFLQFPSFMT